RRRGRVLEHAVAAAGAAGEGVEGRVVDRLEQAAGGDRVAAAGAVVRGDVRGARGHRDRVAEADLLPAGRGLVGERGLAEQLAARGPQAADVRSGGARALVEPDAADVPVGVGLELDADLDRRA